MKKHFLRRAGALLVAFAVLLCSSTAIQNYSAQAGKVVISKSGNKKGAPGYIDGTGLIKGFNLYLNGGSTPLSSDGSEEIGSGDTLNIHYNLKDLNVYDGDEQPLDIQYDKYYRFPVPEMLKINTSTTWDVKIDSSHGIYENDVLGIAEYDQDSHSIILHITNEEVFGEKSTLYSTIQDACISFDAKIDETKLSGEIPEQSIDFTCIGGSVFSFIYSDYKPVDAKIEKTGSYDELTRVAEWIITVTEGTNNLYADGLQIKDELTSGNMTYVESTFTVDGVSIPDSAINYSDDKRSLCWNDTGSLLTSDGKGATHTITYQTKFDNQAYLNNFVKTGNNDVLGEMVSQTTSKSLRGANTAELYDITDSRKIDSDSAAVNTGESGAYTWTKKGVNISESGDTLAFKWTVELDTNGFSFNDVIITDTMKNTRPSNAADSNYPSKFLFDPDTLSITKNGVVWDSSNYSINITPAQTVNVDAKDYYTEDGKGNFKLQIPMNGTVNGKYTITYTTIITNAANYRKFNQNKISNNVSVQYKWPGGDGTVQKIPGLTKKAGAVEEKAVIKKSVAANAYDAANHQLTWTITMNSNKQSLQDIIYLQEIVGGTDTNANKLPQKFVKLKNLKIDDTSVPDDDGRWNYIQCQETTEGSGAYKITFNHQDGTGYTGTNLFIYDSQAHKIAFDVVTEITDLDYCENNITTATKRKAYNTVSMLEQAGDNPKPLSSVSASIEPTQTVITNEILSYNFTNRKASWKITVNKPGMSMTDVVVEDNICTGLVDKQSIKVNGVFIEEKTGIDSAKPCFELDENDVLNVYLGDISEQKVITFDTILQPDTPLYNRDESGNPIGEARTLQNYNGDLTLYNRAVLTKTSSRTTPAADAKKIINNKIAEKTFKKIDEWTAEFTININQPKLNLGDGFMIRDVMTKGLELNLPTVKLYEATVESDGSFVKGSLIGKEDYWRKVDILEDGSTQFDFSLPDPSKSYVMTYEATINENVEVDSASNTLYLGVINSDAKNNKITVTSSQMKGFGKANTGMVSGIRIKKVNKDKAEKALSGATFVLKYDGQEIKRATTNASGLVTFRNLVPGEWYTIHETQAPKGYGNKPEIVWEADGSGAQVVVEQGTEGRYIRFQALAIGDFALINNPPVFKNQLEQFAITKTDRDGEPLAGAGFGLFQETVEDFENSTPLAESTLSDEDGKAIFSFCEEGTYQIKEITAPGGYLLSDTVLMVEIDANGAVDALYEKGDTEKNHLTTIADTKVDNLIFTKKDDKGQVLSGAVFAAYQKTDNVSEATPESIETSNKKGKVIFDKLGAGTWQIVEQEAPAGYVKSEDVFLAEIDENGHLKAFYKKGDNTKKLVTEIVNNEIQEIHLIKKSDDGKVLQGAVFGLFDKEETEYIKANARETVVSDELGNVIFSEEKPGTYKIVELQPPDGYFRSDIVIMAVMNKDGSVEPLYAEGDERKKALEEVINVKIKGIHLTKRSGTGETLAGAKFGLFTMDSLAYTEEMAREIAISDEQGNVIFNEKEAGTYRIVELEAPDGYVKSPLVLVATRNKKGTVEPLYQERDDQKNPITDIRNNKKGQISLVKTNAKGKFLAGAVFGLFKKDADVRTDEPVLQAVSNEQGAVSFSHVEPGEYLIAEISAPEGYTLSEEVLVAVMGDDGVAEPLYRRDDTEKVAVTSVINTKKKESGSTDEADNGENNSADENNSNKDKKIHNGTENQHNGDDNGVHNGTAEKLPETGYENVMPYYVSGGLMIIIGFTTMVVRRKKKYGKKKRCR